MIINLKGKVIAQLFRAKKLIQRVETHNLVVTAGDEVLAGILAGGADEIHGMNLGTGVGAAAKGDVALGTQLANSYSTMEATYPKNAVAVVQSRCIWAAGEATQNSLSEVGLWEAGTDGVDPTGVLIARAILSPVVNKGASDTLQVDWEITLLGA